MGTVSPVIVVSWITFSRHFVIMPAISMLLRIVSDLDAWYASIAQYLP